MIDDYINSLNKIVSRIRKGQSNQDPGEKIQSWSNLLEELRILDKKYNTYKDAMFELKRFDPEEEKPPTEEIFPDLCAELQYNLVESAKEFHLQIYKTISSFMRFISTSIAESKRKGLTVGKVSSFYSTILEISDLTAEIQLLKKSYDFRVFITHPTQFKNYNWMTFRDQIIYFHPAQDFPSKTKMKELREMLQNKEIFKYLPLLKADDFKCPPEPDITYDSLKKLIKNIVRKFGDR